MSVFTFPFLDAKKRRSVNEDKNGKYLYILGTFVHDLILSINARVTL